MLKFVSNSEDKRREYQSILSLPSLIRVPFHESVEVVDDNLGYVCRKKALATKEFVEPPFFIEHTALYIKALGDWPGSNTQPFLAKRPVSEILKLIEREDTENRKAVASVAIGYFPLNEATPTVWETSVVGFISPEERGSNGFGWDQVFIPKGKKRTYAEMDPDEKNSISMRAVACAELTSFLVRDGLVTNPKLKFGLPSLDQAAKGFSILGVITRWFGG